jgi:hypothetical protein
MTYVGMRGEQLQHRFATLEDVNVLVEMNVQMLETQDEN